MSKRALEAVKVLEASGGVWLPRASWRAMRIVARYYHEGLGFAFANLGELADEVGMSKRHLRRTIAELDELGLVRRNMAQRIHDNSDASSEYELPWYRLVNAGAAVRGKIFTVPRARMVPQERLALPARDESKLSPWLLFLDRMRRKNAAFNRCDDLGGFPIAPSGDLGGSPAGAPGDDLGGFPIAYEAVDRMHECPRGEDEMAAEGRTGGPPVEWTNELHDELFPPIAPPEHCGALCDRGKAAESPGPHGQPTHLQKLACQYPGSQLSRCSSSGRGRQARQPRDFAAHRRALDGEDAVLWDVTSEVLRACGVSPESSGRKQRRAVAEALRLYTHESGRALGEAGDLAIRRRREYQEIGGLLFAPLGVTQFFASGLWLTPELWRCDRDALEQMRLSTAANVGRR